MCIPQAAPSPGGWTAPVWPSPPPHSSAPSARRSLWQWPGSASPGSFCRYRPGREWQRSGVPALRGRSCAGGGNKKGTNRVRGAAGPPITPPSCLARKARLRRLYQEPLSMSSSTVASLLRYRRHRQEAALCLAIFLHKGLEVVTDYNPARQTIPQLMRELGYSCERVDGDKPIFRFLIRKG